MSAKLDWTALGILRQGTLYGAASGMLIGLIIVGCLERNNQEEVTIWRNFILSGAALGFTIAAIICIARRFRTAPPS